MSENDNQNTDPQRDAEEAFERGSPLSIFSSDRREDLIALTFALMVAVGVYVIIGG